MLVYRSTGTCLEINRKLDILGVGERAGFRPPSFPYRMKWTRRDSDQLLRVLFIVRVMLSGRYHISLSPPVSWRGPRLGRSGLSPSNAPTGSMLLLSPENLLRIAWLLVEGNECRVAPIFKKHVARLLQRPLPAGGLSTTCQAALESLVLIDC